MLRDRKVSPFFNQDTPGDFELREESIEGLGWRGVIGADAMCDGSGPGGYGRRV
jgi:hypothetical protein